MKVLFAFVLFCITVVAHAETIVINPPHVDDEGNSVAVPFACAAAYRTCINVPTDAGVSVTTVMDIQAGPNPGYPQTTIILRGVAYSGRMQTFGNYNVFSGQVSNATTGAAGFLTLKMHSTRPGGGRYPGPIHWWLDGGVFQQ